MGQVRGNPLAEVTECHVNGKRDRARQLGSTDKSKKRLIDRQSGIQAAIYQPLGRVFGVPFVVVLPSLAKNTPQAGIRNIHGGSSQDLNGYIRYGWMEKPVCSTVHANCMSGQGSPAGILPALSLPHVSQTDVS